MMNQSICKRIFIGLTLVLLATMPAPGQRFPGIFDVAEIQDAARAVVGQNVGDQIKALATGDFNADGLADTLLGSTEFDGPNLQRPGAGGAYIVFGSLKGVTFRRLGSQAASREDVTLFGADEQDRFARSAASGDINDDGIDDIIIGAPRADGPGNTRQDAGEIYIFFGSPNLMAGTTRDAAGVLAPAADVTIFGQERRDTLGASLALGDVNGDGSSDLIVGATGTFGLGNFRAAAGSVYVIFGGRRLNAIDAIDLADPLSGADVVIHGADPVDQAGFAVAAGDLDGDGVDDIAFSVPQADGPFNSRTALDSGEVQVVFGGADLADEPVRDLSRNFAPGADLAVFGQFPGDGLGRALAIGDLSGDGIDDLVISAQALVRPPGQTGQLDRSRAGEVYVILGRRTLPFEKTRDIGGTVGPPADLTIFGADGQTSFFGQADEFGVSLILADVDGDRIDDLIVGAPGADGAENQRLNSGEVYVIFGGRDLFLGLQRDIAGEVGRGAELAFLGPDAGVNFGLTLAVADLDLDGVNDLIVAAPFSAGPGGMQNNAGEIFLISGK